MHILSTKQFLDHKVLDDLFAAAAEMEDRDAAGKLSPVLAGKILATVFYEPSTRTRFSFEAAMLKLGGEVISTESAGHFSSAVKGETLEDTMRIISGYADVIVLRHPEEGAAAAGAAAAGVPLINAGDGSGEHPTQALLDMYTISKELGRVDGLRVALSGDLKNGRTVHSLLRLLGVYKEVKVSLVSPPALALPGKYKEELKDNGVAFEETEDLSAAAGAADVLYVTRIQKERFRNPAEYERLKDAYIVGTDTLAMMKEKAIIMHPLPRVNEISAAVDADPRAAYFRQAKNGLYIRMALLGQVLAGK
jgi:aspartate carbamoyltransferase catalytic subunit